MKKRHPLDWYADNTPSDDKEYEIRSLVASGMHLKGIAKKIGVSRTTIEKYIKKYNLRKLKLQSLKDIDLLEKGKIIRYYLEGYFMLKSSNIILLAPEEKRCLCQ